MSSLHTLQLNQIKSIKHSQTRKQHMFSFTTLLLVSPSWQDYDIAASTLPKHPAEWQIGLLMGTEALSDDPLSAFTRFLMRAGRTPGAPAASWFHDITTGWKGYSAIALHVPGLTRCSSLQVWWFVTTKDRLGPTLNEHASTFMSQGVTHAINSWFWKYLMFSLHHFCICIADAFVPSHHQNIFDG